jgi:hypothetical protein
LAYIRNTCQFLRPREKEGKKSGRGKKTHLQAELADGLAVLAGLLRRGGRSQLNVVDAEGIEGCGAIVLVDEVEQEEDRMLRHTLGTVGRAG